VGVGVGVEVGVGVGGSGVLVGGTGVGVNVAAGGSKPLQAEEKNINRSRAKNGIFFIFDPIFDLDG